MGIKLLRAVAIICVATFFDKTLGLDGYEKQANFYCRQFGLNKPWIPSCITKTDPYYTCKNSADSYFKKVSEPDVAIEKVRNVF